MISYCRAAVPRPTPLVFKFIAIILGKRTISDAEKALNTRDMTHNFLLSNGFRCQGEEGRAGKKMLWQASKKMSSEEGNDGGESEGEGEKKYL